MKPVNFVVALERRSYLVLRDVGPWSEHRPITNDIAHVVALVLGRLCGRRLFYIDTHGALTEVVRRDNRIELVAADRLPPATPAELDAETYQHIRTLFAEACTARDAQRCRVCGCTDDAVCPDGCEWVEEDLCSNCVQVLDAGRIEMPIPNDWTDE